MKNCLTLMCLVLLATTAAAADTPISKGSVMLGGDLYFQSEGGEFYKDVYGDNLTTIGFYPRVGGFVSNGLAVSAEVELLSQSSGGHNATLFGIGPRLAYYFSTDKTRTEIKGSVYPYVAGLGTIGSLSSSGSESITVIKYGGDLGLLMMISNSAAADLSVRVTNDRYSHQGAAENGLKVHFGVGITAFIL